MKCSYCNSILFFVTVSELYWRQSDFDSCVLTQLIFLAGSTDVSTEDISALLSQSNSTVSVYTYSLLGESNNSSELKTRSVNKLQEMARTSNGKFEVKWQNLTLCMSRLRSVTPLNFSPCFRNNKSGEGELIVKWFLPFTTRNLFNIWRVKLCL